VTRPVGAVEQPRGLRVAQLSLRGGSDAAAEELDDVVGRRPRREHLGDAEALQLGDVVGGDGPTDGDEDVFSEGPDEELNVKRTLLTVAAIAIGITLLIAIVAIFVVTTGITD
jgi:hypothetical protein